MCAVKLCDPHKNLSYLFHGLHTGVLISSVIIAASGADYLALGHIHYNVVEPLDSRGVYAYSGCLEGRGFDETGEKGFVLIEVENNIDLKIIQEYLGHSTMATTANFYLHPNINQKERAVNVMSNLLYVH